MYKWKYQRAEYSSYEYQLLPMTTPTFISCLLALGLAGNTVFRVFVFSSHYLTFIAAIILLLYQDKDLNTFL